MTPRLEIDGLTVRAATGVLVGPLSLAVPPGGSLTIMGETGAGKSVLAQAILGDLPPGLEAEGKIVLDGRRVDTLVAREREGLWGRAVVMLPQEPWRALDPLMRARAQVAEVHQLVAGRSAAKARSAADADFADLGLSGAEDRLPGALSGGMAQRVAFAAARAGGADLLLADEPTKGLDSERAAAVVTQLARAVAAGNTLVAITHDIEVARRLGGSVVILKDGAVVEAGAAKTVLGQPKTAYAQALVAADPAAWPRGPVVAAGEEVLRAEGLAVSRTGHTLFRDFEMAVGAGERIAVTGPSGAGKTSLLDALCGLLAPAAGRVLRGPAVGPLGIQKLYQEPPAAFPPQVALGRVLNDVARRHDLPWTRISDLVTRLGIAPALLNRRPDAVSGGELQRIALARLLALAPAVLLADEPTSRLDPITQRDVMDLISTATAETGTAVVLVTHSGPMADRWAVRRYELPSGELLRPHAGKRQKRGATHHRREPA